MNNKKSPIVFAILLTSCNQIDDTNEPPKDFNQVKIPGNHAINNPLAVRYNGDNATPVDHITPQQFKELYKDFGYDPAQVLEFGPELCYVAEPIQGLWVLGIDGCIYKNNIAENDPCVAGELDAVRMKWITDKAKGGKDLGKKIS